MREIKFRGKRKDNGEYVYGDLKHMTGGRVGIHYDHRVACTEVEPDSVGELLGHDKNGREIYEGDRIIEPDGKERLVSFNELTFIEDELKEQSS